jgi:hypothetical protein
MVGLLSLEDGRIWPPGMFPYQAEDFGLVIEGWGRPPQYLIYIVHKELGELLAQGIGSGWGWSCGVPGGLCEAINQVRRVMERSNRLFLLTSKIDCVSYCVIQS